MPPKREVISLRKGDLLTLTCEWQDCQEVFEVMTDFLLHVTDHLEGTATSEKHDDEWFVCHWRECGLDALSEFVELVRHVYFHAFHVKIKSIGMSLILKNQLRGCLLESVSRNMIPELPDQLQCGWVGCEALFDNAERFYIHVRSHADCYTEGNNVPGGCRCMWEGCSMVAKSKHKLKDHVKSHTQEKVVACPTCGSLFSNTTKFFDHIKRQTDTEVQNYQCSHCSKKFATERLLRDHMRHHVNHYKCPFCDMTCPTPSGLRTHIRYRHTTEKPFKCDECEFRGKTSAVLRRHMETHSKTWFKCDMDSCKFKSHNLCDMNSHYRKCHEGPSGAKYMCHLCDMRYERGHRLTLHLKKKHKFKWPSGHNRFRYKLHEDGLYRLQTVRYESIELAEQMLGSDNKIDDSDSTGNMSETVAAPSIDDDYSYNLQMLGEVALHFPKGYQSLKGSETDLEGETDEREGSDDMGGSVVQSVRHQGGHHNDSVVDSTCDSMEDGMENDFGGEDSQEVAKGGSDTSHQVEKYVLCNGVKLSIPPGTIDVIDNMLVCVSPLDVTPTTSHDDVSEMVTVIATGDSSSSQMEDSGSVEGPSQNVVFTEVPTVLDLSHNLDFVITRSDTWDSDEAEDLSHHG